LGNVLFYSENIGKIQGVSVSIPLACIRRLFTGFSAHTHKVDTNTKNGSWCIVGALFIAIRKIYSFIGAVEKMLKTCLQLLKVLKVLKTFCLCIQ
jgi:hypothetical protein